MTWAVGGASPPANCPCCGAELPTAVAEPDYDDGNDPADAGYVIDHDAGHEANAVEFSKFLQCSNCGSAPRRALVPGARVAVVDDLLVQMAFGDVEARGCCPAATSRRARRSCAPRGASRWW
jgi:hypothetical protein